MEQLPGQQPPEKSTEEVIEEITQKVPDGLIENNQNNSDLVLPLDKICDYYLSGKGLPSKQRELLQQVLLSLISLSGATLYALPANDFAIHHGNTYAGYSLLMRQINYIGATCIPAVVVLYNATDIFFNMRRNESVPDELKEVIKQTSGAGAVCKDIFLLIGAGISAVPLVMISFSYPLPIDSQILKITQAAVIGVDNTVLHFLPLKLAMEYKIYRLPVLPFEWIVNQIIKCCRKNPSVEIITNFEEEKQARLDAITRLRTKLLLKPAFSCLSYEWNFSKKFKRQMKNPLQKDLWPILLKEFPLESEPGFPPSKIQEIFGGIAGVLGAGWILGSCSGYILGPINQFLKWTKSPLLTGLAVSPSLYFMSVLLSFFGYHAGKGLYDNLTRWGANEPKLPLEFKLYPKTFLMLTALNLYIALYSYAAAEELIQDNFRGPVLDDIRPYMIWLSRTGLSFLGLNAMTDFYKIILKKWAINFGNDDAKIAAKLMACLEQLSIVLPAAALEKLEEVENKSMSESEDNIKQQGHLEREFSESANYSWKDYLKNKACCFWGQKTYSSNSRQHENFEEQENLLTI